MFYSSFVEAIKWSFMHQNVHAIPCFLISLLDINLTVFDSRIIVWHVSQKQGMHNCKVRMSSGMHWGGGDLDGIYRMHGTGLVSCLLYAQVRYHSLVKTRFPTILLKTLHPEEFKGKIRLWGIPMQLWKGPLCLGIELPFVVSALSHSGF